LKSNNQHLLKVQIPYLRMSDHWRTFRYGGVTENFTIQKTAVLQNSGFFVFSRVFVR
jgi:hypothetical protein